MIKLSDILLELAQTKHYLERKAERGKIVDIRLQAEAYGEYNKKEVKEKLKPILQQELDSRFRRLENADYTISEQKNVAVRFFNPTVIVNSREYPIAMIAENGEEGYCYLAFIIDNTLTTIYPAMVTSKEDIEARLKDHEEREVKNGREAQAFLPENANVKIDLDKLFGKEKQESGPKTEEDLPYIVKAAYKPGSKFELKEPIIVKGKPVKIGKIASADISGQRAGEPNSGGTVDWVKVDFGKEKLVGGKIQPEYMEFKPVYTSIYFNILRRRQ